VRYKPLEIDPAGIRSSKPDPSGIKAVLVPHDIEPKYITKRAMAIHVLTGRMGAGKSTRAKKMGYDVVIGTDTGKISGGKYERPVDVEKVRQAKLRRALTADARGKRVLVEGHPNGVEKIFGPHVGRISKVMEIDTKPSVAMGRVKSRAAKRGTNPAADAKIAKFYNRLYSKSLGAISKGGKLVEKIGSISPRSLVQEFRDRAKQEGHDDFFAVVGGKGKGGASVYSATSKNSAARNARQAHMEWERKNGIDTDHDWSKENPLKKIAAGTFEGFADELQKIASSPKDDANALFGLPLAIKRRPGTRKYETEGSGAAASPDRSTSPVTGQSTANVAGSNTVTPATGPGGV
jgi:hypothetical protein